MRQRGDFVAFVLGGLIVFIFFWFKHKSGKSLFAPNGALSQNGSGLSVVPPSNGGSTPGCGCPGSNEQPSNIPIVIPDNNINATSGRFYPHEGFAAS